jgi:dihydroorotate dehydrogenase electron transfer subunit
MMKVNPGIDPLLRRPFSIHRVHRKTGEIELLIRVKGHGTSLLQQVRMGDTFDLVGPLGNGFSLEGDFSRAMVVAGGMGIAPMDFLIDELMAADKKITLLWGALDNKMAGLPIFRKKNVSIQQATEDGSLGHRGLVTDVFPKVMKEFGHEGKARGFVCGPKPMLKAFQPLASDNGFDWEVSLEENMACGIGVCFGCAVKTTSNTRMVCSDGPIFPLKEILFDG